MDQKSADLPRNSSFTKHLPETRHVAPYSHRESHEFRRVYSANDIHWPPCNHEDINLRRLPQNAEERRNAFRRRRHLPDRPFSSSIDLRLTQSRNEHALASSDGYCVNQSREKHNQESEMRLMLQNQGSRDMRRVFTEDIRSARVISSWLHENKKTQQVKGTFSNLLQVPNPLLAAHRSNDNTRRVFINDNLNSVKILALQQEHNKAIKSEKSVGRGERVANPIRQFRVNDGIIRRVCSNNDIHSTRSITSWHQRQPNKKLLVERATARRRSMPYNIPLAFHIRPDSEKNLGQVGQSFSQE